MAFCHLSGLMRRLTKGAWLLCIVVGAVCPTVAQEISGGEEIVEEEEKASEQVTDLLEELQRLQTVKIPINRATFKDFLPLIEAGLVTEAEARAILRYRDQYGPLKNLAELQGLQAITPEALRRLFPYLRIDSPEEDRQRTRFLFTGGKHQLVFLNWRLLELQYGYTTRDSFYRFLGSPWKTQFRYRYYHPVVQWGVTMEKDAGEPFLQTVPNYGFFWMDYFSAYVAVSLPERWVLRRVLLGDFAVRWGQGLVIWTDFAWGKSSAVLQFLRGGQAFRPYTSVVENRAMRGLATEWEIGSFKVQAFVSRRKVDVRLSDQTVETLPDTFQTLLAQEQVPVATSLLTSGYHRNLSELRFRHAGQLSAVGARLVLHRAWGQVAAGALYTHLNAYLTPYRAYLYNAFYFRGQTTTHAFADFSVYPFTGVRLAGEVAWLLPDIPAYSVGMQVSPYRRLHAGLLYRRWSPAYWSFFARPFGEYYRGQNEEGLYLTVSGRLTPAWEFAGYIDLYRHPWFRWRRDLPSTGWEYFWRIVYKFAETGQMYVQGRQEQFLASATTDNPIDSPYWYVRRYVRFHVQMNLPGGRRVQFRVQHSRAQTPQKDWGVLAYVHLQTRIARGLRAYGRMTYFYTTGWSSRIYAYEPAVPFTFPVAPHYGHGFRYVLMVRYRFAQGDVWLRFARTRWLDRSRVGSWLTAIPAPHRSEITVLLRLRF